VAIIIRCRSIHDVNYPLKTPLILVATRDRESFTPRLLMRDYYQLLIGLALESSSHFLIHLWRNEQARVIELDLIQPRPFCPGVTIATTNRRREAP
jgi:hypothetical protein